MAYRVKKTQQKTCDLGVLQWTTHRAKGKGQKQTQRFLKVACENTEERIIEVHWDNYITICP